MTLDEALDALKERVQAGRAEGMAKYHKAPREYLGIANPDLNEVTKEWRKALTVETRVRLAGELWQTDIFEARLAAAKLGRQISTAGPSPITPAWQGKNDWSPIRRDWTRLRSGPSQITSGPAAQRS